MPDGSKANDRRFVEALRAALMVTAVADTFAAPTPPDQLLEMIVRAAARAIPCPEGALLLVDHAREVLTFDVVIGSTATTVKDLVVPLGHGIAGLVAVSGQALAVANAQEDPRHARDIAEQSGYLPRTILAVPVMAPDGAPIGVLELLDRQGQATFDLGDMDLLGAFADQVSVVLGLRSSQQMLGARIGSALAFLAGLPPETEHSIAARAQALSDRIASDDRARRTAELATLVAAIAARGEAEQQACAGVLRALADYLDSRPSLDGGMLR